MNQKKSETRKEKTGATGLPRPFPTYFLFSLFYFLILAASAAATTVTGTIKRPDGTLVNGTIEFVLSQQAKTTTPPILFAPVRTTCAVTDGVIAAGCTVQGNDTLDPAGTYYTVRVLDANNLVIVPAANYTIAGASVDLGTLPITATATLVPPSGNVLGNLSVTGNLTVGGSADFQGDPDDFSHLRLLGLSADPATATDGSMFHRSDLNRLRFHVRGLQLFDGTQYVDITSVEPNTVEFGGNLKVSGGTILGTSADLKCGPTPPQPDGNSLRLYCPNADEKLYFKDDTNTVLGPLAVLNSAQSWTAQQIFLEANNVVYADAQTGADGGAKLQACVNALPASGGTCDARGLEGAQTISSVLTINKPVKLLLGAATFTCSMADPGQFTGCLNLTSDDVTIEGVGATTVITQGSAANIQALISLNAQKRVTLRNLKLDGNEGAQTVFLSKYYTTIVSTNGGTDYRIEKVEFTAGGNRALDLRGASRVWVVENYCHDSGKNIAGQGSAEGGNCFNVSLNTGTDTCADAWAIGNLAEKFGDTGIGITYCSRVHVLGNTIRGNADFGLTPYNTELGITLTGASDVEVVGNVVRNVGNSSLNLNAFTLSAVLFTPKRARIASNVFLADQTSLAALDPRVSITRGVESAQLENISFSDNTMRGVRLGVNNIDGFTVHGNNFFNLISTTTSAIDMNQGAGGVMKNFSFVGNTFDTDNASIVTAINIGTGVTTPGSAFIDANGVNYENIANDVQFQGAVATNKVIVRTARAMTVQRSSADATNGAIAFKKSRGTSSSPAAIAAADRLGGLTFFGYDGAAYTQAAEIRCSATGTIASGQVPGLCSIFTANSSGALTEAWRVDNNQALFPVTTGYNLGTTGNRPNILAENFKWYAGTSFQGILSHSNTTDRTYTFPDATTALAGLGVANLFTAPGAVTLDNQLGLRLREQSASGTDYIELRAPTSVTTPVTYTWNVQGDCTGNLNAGALTVNASKEIVCSDDDGGSGGGGGDNLSVNATAVTDANFSDTSPAPPGEQVNVKWQLNATPDPDNISAYVPEATATQRGIVTTAGQIFAGQKTFNGGFIARDNNAQFQDDLDNTKRLNFQLSSIAPSTIRTATWPDASGEVSLLGQTIEDVELATTTVVKNNQANTYSGGGLQDLSANKLALPAAITLPGTCTANKEIFVDTDAGPAGQQVYLCNSAGNGWNLIGDGGGAGGGDNISVNATAAADADFDDSTPAAPANSANVRWQKDASSPNNISAHLRFADFATATLGSGAGFTWTFDASAGTDTALAFGDNTADFSGQLGVSTSVGATLSDRANLHAAGVTVTAGTTTNAYGLRVLSHTESGGVITNAYGARIKDQTVGANNWSVFAGPDLSAYKASLQSSMQNSANVFGSLNSAADAQVALLGVHEDNTTTSTWASYGIAEARHTSGTKSALIAFEGDAIASAAGAVTRATGVEGEAYTSGGGTISRLLGVAGYAEQSGTGTTTDMAALLAYTNTRSGGTVTNNYGLLIEDQAGIGTNNWVLRTLGSALAQFGGAVDSASGYRVAGAAASGNYLRGDGTNFVSSAIQGADIASITSTFTNKTLDAEASGNTLTTVSKEILLAAGCNNATAAPGWDLPTSNGPAAACYGTSPQRFGALDFADGAAVLTSTTHLQLPADWTGTIDVAIVWFSGSTSTNSAVWTLATVCVADGEDLLSPTFNSTQTVADANNATANTRNSAALSGITTTGCAAGETMFLRIGRDPTHGSDTLAATASLLELELTLRRAQ